MKKEILSDYLLNGKINIDKLLDDFYGYVYITVKNGVSIYLTDEDIEEIISDVFIAVWKNSRMLSNTTNIKAYLSGTAKNIIRNKYRKNEINFSTSDYEEKIIDNNNLENIVENKEKDLLIKKYLKTLKVEEYKTFIMFYYEGKSTKEIAKEAIEEKKKKNTKRVDYAKIKNEVRDYLGKFFYQETESKPMIITVIQEV